MKPFFSKIILYIFLSLAWQQSPYAQAGIVKLEYKYYTSWFSVSEHIPIALEYTLTAGMLQCSPHIPRAKNFTPDPNHHEITSLAKDYKNSGYDRGHNMNAEDNECSKEGMKECFYFSNMTPQPHSFNAGRWEDVEKIERVDAGKYHRVIVTVGSRGKAGAIGKDSVTVPKFMWKVIYIPSLKKYECYWFPDTDNVTNALSTYTVNISQLEQWADVSFSDGIVKMKDNKAE